MELEEAPDPYRNLVNLFIFVLLAAKRSVRDAVMAVNIETATPRPRVRANPLIAEVPSQKSTTAVMIEEMFESRIESHAR